MEDCTYGKIIRTRRKQLGLTQRELAGDICAISTISRIENEGRKPSRALFDQLTMKLGGSGFFSYELCFTKSEWTTYPIKRQIFDALIYENENRLNEKMELLIKLADFTDKRERQFIQMVYLIDIAKHSENMNVQRSIIKSSLELLGITETQLHDASFMGQKIRLTKWEFFVLNNLAISYLETGRLEESKTISIFLLNLCDNTVLNQAIPGLSHSLVYNNLAVISFYMGDTSLGRHYCKIGYKMTKRLTTGKIRTCLKECYTALYSEDAVPNGLRIY